jgi:hypothetical protein
MMFIEPPTPIWPSNGSLQLGDLGIAAIRADQVFRADGDSLPVSRSRQVVVTPSASCSWLRYSVDIRACVPREQAVLNRSGSMKVCGRSFIIVGEDS